MQFITDSKTAFTRDSLESYMFSTIGTASYPASGTFYSGGGSGVRTETITSVSVVAGYYGPNSDKKIFNINTNYGSYPTDIASVTDAVIEI